MDSDYILVFILVLTALVILFFAFQLVSNRAKKKWKEKQKFVRPEHAISKCPVCGSALVEKEKIFSKVYNTESKTVQQCTIVGCPHCFPHMEMGIRRKCPVCHKNIPQDGYLIAHLFNRKDQKNHVHIVGCTECHKKNK